jgi:hypothetical protein
MSVVSEKQRRFMAVHAYGKPRKRKGKRGPSRAVAREFMEKSRGIRGLPERAGGKRGRKRGRSRRY